MMPRLTLVTVFILVTATLYGQNWTVSEVGQLPEPVSNNAVCEGFDASGSYVYSFSGIDPALSSGGIHLKSWRFNTASQQADVLPDVPDTLGKIAAGASYVNGIIYIIGGYHVLPNGSEVSSNKVHRFNVSQNQFLSDGMPIPVPIDDHVQTVYRDSLIFVVTGWSNTGNVPNVQIYNTYSDSWLVGAPTPNNNRYKCFGASGEIVGDTLYYFGGAAGFSFSARTELRKGYIDPTNATNISWSYVEPDETLALYRSAACKTNGAVHWIGGSNVTYNFDGVAYNGSGLVSPSNQVAYLHQSTNSWGSESLSSVPMDLRGVGSISETEKYLIGGIGHNGVVQKKVLRLDYIGSLSVDDEQVKEGVFLYPNPTNGRFRTNLKGELRLLNSIGQEVRRMNVHKGEFIEASSLENGVYFARINNSQSVFEQLLIVKK